jgi:hypothetical protein
MALSQPGFLNHYFAQLNPTLSNAIPDSTATPGLASWQQGWLTINMTDPLAGGIAPSMQDFNGLFAALSQYAQWQSVGGGFAFSGAYATAVGGYPQGATVRDTTLLGVVWINRLAGNTSDPNTGANITGTASGGAWDFAYTPGPGTAFGCVMQLSDLTSSGATNAVILGSTIYPNYNAPLASGTIVVWKATYSNTGACTISVNGHVAAALVRNDGSPVVAGDIAAGHSYAASFDFLGKFILIGAVTSQFIAAPTYAHASSSTLGPITTASTTGAMAGLAYTITPSATGKVSALVSIKLINAGATSSNTYMELRYGTGAAPIAGAAPTGLVIGLLVSDATAAGNGMHRVMAGILSGLTPGTPYWFDINFYGSNGNTQVGEIMLTAAELP